MEGHKRMRRTRHHAEPGSVVQPIVGGTGLHEQQGITPEKENAYGLIHRRIECIHPGRRKETSGYDQSGAYERLS